MGKKDKDSSSSSGSSSEEEKKEKKVSKEKTKKAKQVIASSQQFSKRYANFFNNKHLSDFTIHIGEEKFHSHKIVLCNNSDFFEKLENQSEFTFPKVFF